MTTEEYEKLKTGDVIENKTTGSKYVVVRVRSTEAITQIAKDDIKTRIDEFDIVMRKV